MLKNYLINAWRNLVKNKTITIINILGLTLGIASCLVIFLNARFELSYDNFHQDTNRIYRVVTTFQESSGGVKYKPTVPKPMAEEIKSGYTGIEKVTQFHIYYAKAFVPKSGDEAKRFDAANKDEEEPSDIIITDPEYFDIFKHEWIAGNVTSMKEPFRVVLTESKANKYFGSLPLEKIIGSEVIYDDSLRLTVAGIVKDYPKNSDFIFHDFISASTINRSFLKQNFSFTNWQSWNGFSQTFVKITQESSLEQFEKQTLDIVKKNMDIGNNTKVNIFLQPLADIHYNNHYTAYYGRTTHLPTIYGLIIIAIFILSIAVFNFINLSTAKLLQRAKEAGIRKVLGSGKAKIVWLFLIETFVLAIISLVFSLIIISPIINSLSAFLPQGVALTFNGFNIAFIVVITIFTAFFAGLYPAKLLSDYTPATALKGSNYLNKSGKNYLRKGLVIFQFAISQIFIIGTLIIGNQMQYLLNTDMGFTKNAIINIPAARNYPKEKMQVLAQQIKQLPEVQAISIDLGAPAEENHWSTIVKRKWSDQEEGIGAQFLSGDENYLNLYQLKIVAGRNLSPCDTMKEYLINETLAKQLGFSKPDDAISQTIAGGGDDGKSSHKQLPIVGVIADFHVESLHKKIAPTFISTSKKYAKFVSVKLAAEGKQLGELKKTIQKIENLWNKVYPTEKFQYKFLDESIAKFYEKEKKTEQLTNIAMVMAIFISCMGLFGLAKLVAQQRIKEIGIRKILGASVSSIIGLISKDFLILVSISILIASPIAYYFMHKWLNDFAYRIEISWWLFTLAGLIALFIAFLTVSFQAVKSALMNPVKSLKTE